MDRDYARDAFERYVSAYDPTNPRIALKVAHTYRVAQMCERIARSLDVTDEFVDLAWMVGLLHDIGRFEQVRRFDTFNDSISVSHATLGVEVLFEETVDNGHSRIRSFVSDDSCDQLIRTAIATHSDYRLPSDLSPTAHMLCDVLRDADKIDILKVNCICPIEDIYGVSDADMQASPLTPACVDLFYEHHCLPRGVRVYPADIMLGHICFAWELVYPASLAIVREQGYLHEMLSRHWDIPATQQAFDEMAVHMERELGL